MTDFETSDRDVTRAIRSWLDEDRHEDASRIAGAVLDRVEATPDRRAGWPAWRTPIMNKFVAIGLGAAAVVVVGIFLGAQLLGSPSGGGTGAGATPTPTVAPTQQPSTLDPTDFATVPAGGTRLAEGDYVFTHMDGVRVVFTASPFWERNIPNWMVWSIDDNKATMGVSTVNDVAVDPCHPELGVQDPAVGPNVDDLVTALSAVPGITFTAPAEVTQDGYSGVRLDYVPPDALNDCLDDMGEAVLMYVEGTGGSDAETVTAPTGTDPFSVYIYDVDGTRVVITAAYTENRTDDLDEMLASIRFELP